MCCLFMSIYASAFNKGFSIHQTIISSEDKITEFMRYAPEDICTVEGQSAGQCVVNAQHSTP